MFVWSRTVGDNHLILWQFVQVGPYISTNDHYRTLNMARVVWALATHINHDNGPFCHRVLKLGDRDSIYPVRMLCRLGFSIREDLADNFALIAVLSVSGLTCRHYYRRYSDSTQDPN